MSETQEWYEEALLGCKVFTTLDENFIIYKGFKIAKPFEGDYEIKDARYSNMYTRPSSVSLSHFREFGFIKGADVISYKRDVKRLESYKKRTARLYDKRKKFKAQLPKDKKLNEKRIRNINRKIGEFVDLIFYYDTRIKHYNNKYN